MDDPLNVTMASEAIATTMDLFIDSPSLDSGVRPSMSGIRAPRLEWSLVGKEPALGVGQFSDLAVGDSAELCITSSALGLFLLN